MGGSIGFYFDKVVVVIFCGDDVARGKKVWVCGDVLGSEAVSFE